MLSLAQSESDRWFTLWRDGELARIDREGLTYLDYGGATPYPASLLRTDMARLDRSILGNPHSEHRASLNATEDLDAARKAILEFLHADPDEYDVALTANASAAARLVGEGFPFGPESILLLTADNHNSVNGLREFARRAGSQLRTIALDDDLRLEAEVQTELTRRGGREGLFAYPAQSNFSGVRHSLDLIAIAQSNGFRVLLDAAAFLPTAPLDLSTHHPDFVILSIYKIAGYPAGIGALVAKRDALQLLRRPWFAGGTVDWVSVGSDRHRIRSGAGAFEDGTPPYLAAGAVPDALALVSALQPRLRDHLAGLTAELLLRLQALRHGNGSALVSVHGPKGVDTRGSTVAFTLRSQAGEVIPYWEVEVAARLDGIALRGGCFCNPGCAERAFDLQPEVSIRVFEALGPDFSPQKAAALLGGRAVGALRASLGQGSLSRDLDRLILFLTSYLQE